MLKPGTTSVIGFDPGARQSGIAELVWENGVWMLRRAALIRNPVRKGLDLEASRGVAVKAIEWVIAGGRTRAGRQFVGEVPQMYQLEFQKGDQNQLPHLNGITTLVGVAVSDAGWAHQYFPREWKAQIDADVCVDRVRERLSQLERSRMEPCPESLVHNVYDAIGIALKFVGRFEPLRVNPF